MNIRKYREPDRAQLTNLWATVFPDDPPHNAPQSVIDSKLAVDDLIFIAETNGLVKGACIAGYDGHRGWLYAVAVLPEQRGQTIGSALVQHATEQLQEIGCIKVNLQIRSDNDVVQKFYEKMGFTTEPRISMGKLL